MTAPRSAISLSWIRYHGRSADLAERLGVPAEFVSVGRLGQRVAVLWRYPVQAVLSVRALRRQRPDALLVMAPPLPLVLLALAWRGRSRRVVIDAHSAAVISPRTGRPRRRFAFIARFADLVLVTRTELAAQLPGSRVLALDDPPVAVPDVPAERRRRDGLRDRVLFPCSWYADEPVADVIAAARALPDVEVVLTGDPARSVDDDLPANVTLTGYMDNASYWSMLRGADLVLALTARDDTMQRAGYEALAAGVPLVVSDTDALRSWYGDAAVPASPGSQALARAIAAALARREELARNGRALREVRAAEFDVALRTLRAALGLDAELVQERREAVAPAVVLDDEPMRVGRQLATAGGVGQQLGEPVGELLRGVGAREVALRLGVDAADAERRGDNGHAGAEGVEHLEPAAATAVDRNNHHGGRSPHGRKVVDETQRAHPLALRRATATHHLQLDEPRRPG